MAAVTVLVAMVSEVVVQSVQEFSAGAVRERVAGQDAGGK